MTGILTRTETRPVIQATLADGGLHNLCVKKFLHKDWASVQGRDGLIPIRLILENVPILLIVAMSIANFLLYVSLQYFSQFFKRVEFLVNLNELELIGSGRDELYRYILHQW